MSHWSVILVGMIRRSGAVRAAVRRFLDAADEVGVEHWSVTGVLPVVEHVRCRPLTVLHRKLPDGVTARWTETDAFDLVVLHDGWPTRDRALAHEIGHMILNHEGSPDDSVAAALTHVGGAAITRMLCRSCADTDDPQEHEAELFAATLLRALDRRAGFRRVGTAGVLAEAFG